MPNDKLLYLGKCLSMLRPRLRDGCTISNACSVVTSTLNAIHVEHEICMIMMLSVPSMNETSDPGQNDP